MKVVIPRSDITVPVEHGRSAITLTGGVAYVMHDVEAASGAQAGVFASIHELPPWPRPYAPQEAVPDDLVLPFIGGLGDAVAMLAVLDALLTHHPALRLTIASTAGPAEIFELSGLRAAVLPYPPTLDGWRSFGHHLTMERVHETGQQPGRPLTETFAEAVGIELRAPLFDLRLPIGHEDVGRRAGETSLIGVAAGDGHSLRAYPLDLLRSLLAGLAEAGLHSVVLGLDDPAWSLPFDPQHLTDLRSKTDSVLELAVWLNEMDVVVTHDSFVMHLAGALGRPVVALFAPTSSGLAPRRSNVCSLSSDATCAPCHLVGDRCPIGHDRCIAWESAPLEPSRVAREVLAIVEAGARSIAVAAGRDGCYK